MTAEDLPRLRRVLDEARERARRLARRRVRLRTEIDATAALRAVPAKPRREDPYPRPASVEPVLALADFVDTRLTSLHESYRAVDAECRQADHDVTLAKHRLDEASGALRTAETQTTAAAVLTLDIAEFVAGEVLLDVEYQVPGARWVPQYQLRLDPAMTGGSLVMRAAVAQRTGEDWSGVRLGLSTADLDRRTDLPELRSCGSAAVRPSRRRPAGASRRPGWTSCSRATTPGGRPAWRARRRTRARWPSPGRAAWPAWAATAPPRRVDEDQVWYRSAPPMPTVALPAMTPPPAPTAPMPVPQAPGGAPRRGPGGAPCPPRRPAASPVPPRRPRRCSTRCPSRACRSRPGRRSRMPTCSTMRA
ncbi:DUF4139 domain-containing protein [Yinghuangia aomiensis]